MRISHLIPALVWMAAFMGSLRAELIYAIDFDSLTPGPVTVADLTAAGTGSTNAGWFINTNRGSVITIEADAGGQGDLALLADDPDTTGNNGTLQFHGFNLFSHIELSSLGPSDRIDVTFEFASFRNGANKRLVYRLAADDNTQALNLRWNNDGSLYLNDVQFAGADGSRGLNPNLTPWDSTSPLVHSALISVFGDGSVSGTFLGQNFSGNLLNSVTNIDRFQFHSDGSAAAQKGGYINDLRIETFVVPEPSSLMLAVFGILLIFRLRR